MHKHEPVQQGNYQDASQLPGLVGRLYDFVSELEALFPGRYFTPDGRLVGSLGEVLAAYRYGLELLPASAERHDARTSSGALVQIKATQGKRVSLGGEPDHLIVLLITRDGRAEEAFNGPGPLAWNETGQMQMKRAVSYFAGQVACPYGPSACGGKAACF